MLGNNTEGCKLDRIGVIGKRIKTKRAIEEGRSGSVNFVFYCILRAERVVNGVNIFRYLGKVRERDLAARRSLRAV